MKPKYALPFGYLSAVSNCSMSGVHEQLFPVICPRAAPPRVSCLDVKQFPPSQRSAQGHLMLHSRATYQHHRLHLRPPLVYYWPFSLGLYHESRFLNGRVEYQFINEWESTRSYIGLCSVYCNDAV